MIWTMEPTAKKLEDVETKVGNVGSTDLQSQVNALNSKFANLGLFAASTESDFFTEVVNQIKTYANGTYVFSAAWQYTSVYIITASKFSDTRIIGSAVPKMQNGRDMVVFSYEGTTLNLYPLALKSKLAWTSLGETASSGISTTPPSSAKELLIIGYKTSVSAWETVSIVVPLTGSLMNCSAVGKDTTMVAYISSSGQVSIPGSSGSNITKFTVYYR